MGTFELVEHTADQAVRATGADFAEALAWLARGMFSYIADLGTVAPKEELQLTLAAPDYEALVVDWLNELLYRYEADRFLPAEFHVRVEAQGTRLQARCRGETVDPARHTIFALVKAATYHNLRVVHDGQWQITVVLDV